MSPIFNVNFEECITILKRTFSKIQSFREYRADCTIFSTDSYYRAQKKLPYKLMVRHYTVHKLSSEASLHIFTICVSLEFVRIQITEFGNSHDWN